jgi:tetratricopeptide (TPR) repeat protein
MKFKILFFTTILAFSNISFADDPIVVFDAKKDAIKIWLRAAKEGTGEVSTNAMYNLAVAYHKLGGVFTAKAWLKRAADLGHVRAIENYEKITSQEYIAPISFSPDFLNPFEEKNYTQAINTWLRSAKEGIGEVSTNAMYNLAVTYHKLGWRLTAKAWLKRAADLGHVRAIENYEEITGEEYITPNEGQIEPVVSPVARAKKTIKGDKYRAEAGDTLFEIVKRADIFNGKATTTIKTLRIASILYKNNLHAFTNGSMNFLVVGKTLNLSISQSEK